MGDRDMNLLQMFKRKLKTNYKQENLKVIRPNIVRHRAMVVQAVREINRPCTGRTVARHLGWDSACVTNRLAEAAKKGELKIVDVKPGFDKVWRRYYVVAK